MPSSIDCMYIFGCLSGYEKDWQGRGFVLVLFAIHT
jgi:hypothetical protein